MSLETRVMPLIFGLCTFSSTHAQKTAEAIQQAPIIETIAKDTVEISKKISQDVSLRTFQFLNGNNLTAVGVGFGKNKGKLTAYISPLGGYDFANKKPWIGAFGFLDKRYHNINKNIWISRELYGEFTKGKGMFDSKIAGTFLKFNFRLNKNSILSIDPRGAAHINNDGLTSNMETLVTYSGQINKRWSYYVLGQSYDTTNLGKSGWLNNVGINGGIVYNIK